MEKAKMASAAGEEQPTEVKTFQVERQEGGEQNIIRKSWDESKKMWEIAGPAILVSVSQFSIGFVTVAFAGHLGELELAAVTITTNVIEGFVFVGNGKCTRDTMRPSRRCRTTQHARNLSPKIMDHNRHNCSMSYAVLSPRNTDTKPTPTRQTYSRTRWKILQDGDPSVLRIRHQFPIQKFLQSQTKVWVMTTISVLSLGCHVLLNWAFVTKLELGLLGAAMAGNISWWLQVIAMVIYVVSGFFPDSWTGLSLLAFKSLWGFVKLSLASAVMLCLELWYFTAIILMVGYLKDPTLAVDSISICMNLQLWTSMVTLGFNVAASVRVSNELGAGRPRAAKFSIVVTVLTSLAVGITFAVVILATKHDFPKLFSDKPPVIKAASKLDYFLAATIFLNSILPVLHGVAVGAGWQAYVGLINIVCYYLFGIPAGAVLGFKFNLRVQGIWSGMLVGTVLQTTILLFLMLRATWRKEAVQAEERLRTWGGPNETPETMVESRSAD
ncbi:hypothetical protein GQ457_01G000240 [Hibiscus cannabinus]